MRLRDKIAIVTGGGRGIGRGISVRFAAEGATVVIAQRDPTSALRTVADIETAGGQALSIPTDVSEPAQVEALVGRVLERFGRIDILINNAGLTGANGPFLAMPLETWRRILDVNLTGMFLCGQAVARAMVERGIPGRIVNVGSINSFAAEKEAAAYVASKGAILALTRAMAVELAPYGIIVNCLAPGPIRVENNAPLFDAEPTRTGIARGVPLGRPGVPEETAAAALFLASDECTFVVGTSLVIDGGYLAYLRFD
jgi:NAD(P)-dependent dehydrogenase (short-subunit alcohol dehydrogenase family)